MNTNQLVKTKFPDSSIILRIFYSTTFSKTIKETPAAAFLASYSKAKPHQNQILILSRTLIPHHH